ncbi:MAG: YafY family transcriptional regulator [Lachnospiraceae bacterium]|nr:YafY family transcriptional regulator [Lachnospiraceae bacterium]
MQESRLFKIVYYLLEKGHATAPELAERFEVSARTIYRDIDALSEAGIPVYAETGRNGGIYLLEDFVLNKALLSEKEKQEILASLQSLSAVGAFYDKNMITKLSALFKVASEDWMEADFSRWGEITRDNEKFEQIKTAVITHKVMRIQYEGSYHGGSERIIYPLKLLYKAKEWYLKAFCTKKQDFRLFKLTRIIEWDALEETFEPMIFPKYEEESVQEGNSIILRFSKEMAYRVFDEFDMNQVTRLENGDLQVDANMPEDEWLIGYLLSFGTQVDVIQPMYLKEILAKRAKEIYEKNKS